MDDTIVKIGTLNIGNMIEIKHNDTNMVYFYENNLIQIKTINCCIVAHSTDKTYMCIAWNGEPSINYDHFNKKLYLFFAKTCRYSVINDFIEYEHFCWVFNALTVRLCNKVINNNQLCIDCNVSAPHANPNMPDNKFKCINCKIIEELL